MSVIGTNRRPHFITNDYAHNVHFQPLIHTIPINVHSGKQNWFRLISYLFLTALGICFSFSYLREVFPRNVAKYCIYHSR